MTFRSLALSNVRGNRRAYAAFMLSSVFSVLIFYLYAAFLYHPGVVNGEIYGAGQVRQGMLACEYLIAIFSFFFVLYSNSAFMKTRKKEFGLFSLFGMTRGQIRKMVLYEGVFLALVAIVLGIALGMLLSKLFFMALSVLLETGAPIAFAVPWKAVVLTGAGFFALFLLITLLTLRKAGRSQIVDLLKEANKPKTQPRYSIWLTVLCIVCLAGGYGLASYMSGLTLLVLMLPVIGLTVVGTYFLFTQGSIAAVRMLQRRKPFYYRRTHLLTISQLAFKLKDNARVLFTVSILSAVVLTASGTVYVFQKVQRDQLLEHTPYAVGFYEVGEGAHEVIDPEDVKRILREDGRQIVREQQLDGLLAERVEILPEPGKAGSAETLAKAGTMVVSETGYNGEADKMGLRDIRLGNGQAVVILPYREMEGDDDAYAGKLAEVWLNGHAVGFTVTESRAKAIVNPVGAASFLLVVGDADYARLYDSASPTEHMTAYGYEWKDWEQSLSTVNKIEAAMSPAAANEQAQTWRVSQYLDVQRGLSLTFFIGMFITLLFFVASGSMLYFKMFTELQEDQAQFRSLVRIGMTAAEIRRIVATQVGIVFFVPCLVGIVHALFAMRALGNVLGQSIFGYASIVFVVYVVMQAIYFGISCQAYMRSIMSGAKAETA